MTAGEAKRTGWIVYIGMRSQKGKLVQSWRHVDNKGHIVEDRAEFHFTSWKMSRPIIGVIYEITDIRREDGSYTTRVQGDDAPRFQKMFLDQQAVLEWSAVSNQLVIADKAGKQAQKNPPEFDKAIKPLRQAYHQARTHEQKAALLAIIIQKITG